MLVQMNPHANGRPPTPLKALKVVWLPLAVLLSAILLAGTSHGQPASLQESLSEAPAPEEVALPTAVSYERAAGASKRPKYHPAHIQKFIQELQDWVDQTEPALGVLRKNMQTLIRSQTELMQLVNENQATVERKVETLSLNLEEKLRALASNMEARVARQTERLRHQLSGPQGDDGSLAQWISIGAIATCLLIVVVPALVYLLLHKQSDVHISTLQPGPLHAGGRVAGASSARPDNRAQPRLPSAGAVFARSGASSDIESRASGHLEALSTRSPGTNQPLMQQASETSPGQSGARRPRGLETGPS